MALNENGYALETNLASRWEGVRLPRASGKFPDFPESSPATSHAVLPLWNLRAMRSPGSCPGLPRRSAPVSGKPDSGRLPTMQSEKWLVHAKVREPHLNPPVRMNFHGFPCKTRAGGRKFIRNGEFRCGSRTFARTSHVSDWIAGRGTD